jgi:hypothetical protein
VVDARRDVSRLLIEAVHRPEWIETMIRAQRDGIVAALGQVADEDRHDLN